MAISKWKKSPLKKLCHKIGDGLHGTPEYDERSEILFINGNNLKNGVILASKNTKRVSTSDYESNYIKLNENSLLLSINGTIGSMAFYNNEKVMLGKSAAYLNFKTGINRFYYYYFQLKEVQQYFFNVATGSTIKNLGLKSIQNFEVPSPNDEHWKPIAKILSDLDKKIELNNKINAELETMAKLIYDYWFVQFDFPDANGKPYKSSGGKMVYNEALKREIPDGWEVKKLSEITSLIRRGISPKYVEENGVSVINQKCVRNQKISFEPTRRHGGELKVNDERFLLLKDILVNSTGVGTLGRVAFIKRMEEENTTVDSHVTIVRAASHLINETLLAWQMLRLQPIIEKSAQGSTGQVELNKGYLKDLDIIVPTNYIQEKFENFVVPIETKMSVNEVESQVLLKLRDWLLPMLMNGQVTIKDSKKKTNQK